MECIQSYITKLECLNDNCVQYSMKNCIPKNKYEGTQRLEELFVPFAPLTVTEQYPIAYMDIGEYHDDVNKGNEYNDCYNGEENETPDELEEDEIPDEDEEETSDHQEDVCSEQMMDRFLDAVEVKKNKRGKTKKSNKQPKNKSKRK